MKRKLIKAIFLRRLHCSCLSVPLEPLKFYTLPIENEQWINLDVFGKMKKAIDSMAVEISKLKKENARLKGGIEQKAAVEPEEEWINPLEESGCGQVEEE